MCSQEYHVLPNAAPETIMSSIERKSCNEEEAGVDVPDDDLGRVSVLPKRPKNPEDFEDETDVEECAEIDGVGDLLIMVLEGLREGRGDGEGVEYSSRPLGKTVL